MASQTSATVAGAFARYLALASTAPHPRDFKPCRPSSWDGSDLAPSGGLAGPSHPMRKDRSEEHTSELQSLTNLVCRLLLEKKKTRTSQQLGTTSPSTRA